MSYRVSTQDKIVFETSSKRRKSWDGRKIFKATDKNDLEVALEVLRKGI